MRRVIEKLRKTSIKVSLNIFVNSLIQLHTACGLCTSNLTNRRTLKKRWFMCINTSRFLFFLNKNYLFVYVCVCVLYAQSLGALQLCFFSHDYVTRNASSGKWVNKLYGLSKCNPVQPSFHMFSPFHFILIFRNPSLMINKWILCISPVCFLSTLSCIRIQELEISCSQLLE